MKDKKNPETEAANASERTFSQQWRVPEIREFIIADIARWLSKTGSLGASSWETTLAAPGFLTSDELVELYQQLLARGGRSPYEWHDEFVAAFPQHADTIPPLDRVDLAVGL